jgi:hypothetical protein
MLFPKRLWPGIQDGSITVTVRRWRRLQAIAGRRYRTAAGMIEVEAVDEIQPADLTEADARAAGSPTVTALLGDLPQREDASLYRLRFHAVTEPDPRDELAADARLSADDVAALDRRLARLDGASATGPWTAATLALIKRRPAVRAAELAAELGRERAPFKLDVRKLKALGLTISLERGYRLSPRGRAYLRRTAR